MRLCVPEMHKLMVLGFRLPTEINVNAPSLHLKDSGLGFYCPIFMAQNRSVMYSNSFHALGELIQWSEVKCFGYLCSKTSQIQL